jgi:hypothetical protein
VEPRPPKPKRSTRFDDDPGLGILVTAKHIGLSIQELNLLTMDDYVSFVDLWAGDDDGPRRATQQDINALLG